VTTPVELIERAQVLAGSCGRPDLAERLRAVRQRIDSRSVRVLVVGEAKKGKSSLVNALVGAPVCAVADDVATVVPTVVRHGAAPRATLVLGDGDGTENRVDVALDTLAARPPGAGAGGPEPARVEVELPRRVLEGGLEIVDTAGVGGVGADEEAGTMIVHASSSGHSKRRRSRDPSTTRRMRTKSEVGR